MPDQPKTAAENRADLIVWGSLVGLVLLFFIAIPALIGVALWYPLRHRVRRQEGVIALVTALVGSLIAWKYVGGPYVHWLFVLVTGNGSRTALPWLALVFGALLTFGLLASLHRTPIGTRISNKVLRRDAKDDLSLIPTDTERQRGAIVKPPAEPLVVHADDHSIHAPSQFGTREVPLGVDRNGRVFGLHEQEFKTHGVILGATGSGKALALDTPIATPSGWTTMGELAVGDLVFDESGQPTAVVFATEVQHDRRCFRVGFDDGSTIVADADHRWLVDTHASRRTAPELLVGARPAADWAANGAYNAQSGPDVLTTLEMFAGMYAVSDTPVRYVIDVAHALRLSYAHLSVAPYVLGAQLGAVQGDGVIDDPHVIDELRAEGYESVQWPAARNGITTGNALAGLAPSADVPAPTHQSIPSAYLRASREQRLALLQGLMDTHGTVDNHGMCVFSASSAHLAQDVAELVHTLGMSTRITAAPTTANGCETQRAWAVSFKATLGVFRTERKARLLGPVSSGARRVRRVTEIVEVESVPVRCIQVAAASHLYLAGESMIPTHNTESIKTLTGGLLDIGYSVIMLDLKEDTGPGGLREYCDQYSASHALPYQEIALSDPNPRYWFNPLYGMSTDEAINTLVSLQDFDDGYWQAINRTMIGQICTLFYDAHRVDPQRFAPPDMLTIGRVLRKGSLAAATKEMRAAVLTTLAGRTKEDFSSLADPSADELKSAVGLGARIINTYESDAGRQTLRGGPGRAVLDVTQTGLVYIGLNSLGLSELAKVVSTAVLLRVAAFAGARTTGAATGASNSRIAVIIDEANFIDRMHVQNLLSRCRSAGISVWLCTQGPLDWEEEWPKITTNVNCAIVMRQGNEEAAELSADLIGKQKKSTLLSQVRDGDVLESGTLREEVAHVVSPQELRALRVGEAIISVGVPEPRRSWVKVLQRPPTARARLG